MPSPNYEQLLSPITHDLLQMTELVTAWANINSSSTNLAGLDKMRGVLEKHFASLGATLEVLDLPDQDVIDSKGIAIKRKLGKTIRLRKRPEAPLKVFLGGHYDTVFKVDHTFQKVTRIDDNTLNGPGVSDLKGGLVVLHKALEVLEKSPFAKNLGWEVLINPDEEIGSPGSTPLFEEAARRNHLGLVFEPSLPDGSIVDRRKGTGNFMVVVHGKAAHVGRDHALGRNAILTLAKITTELEAINGKIPGIIVNVGHVEGGGVLNVVPDLAIGRFNVRFEDRASGDAVLKAIDKILESARAQDGITVDFYGRLNRQPKELTPKIERLFEILGVCAKAEGLMIKRCATGGVCDGNTLAAAGLANIDTLGVRGGAIHSDKEFILLDSLVERARLTARFLIALAAGEIKL